MADNGDAISKLYVDSINKLERGFLVAAVPIENNEGRRGLFVINEDVLANRVLKAQALSNDVGNRAAAAIAMILLAHERAGNRGYQTHI